MKHRVISLGVVVAVLASGSITASADPNCRCRLYGEYFDIGSVMCIRGKLSRCEMNRNNTSWKNIGDICPQARLAPLPEQPPHGYAAPLVTLVQTAE